MIAIVDYGMGNLGSIRNMFKRAGFASGIVRTPEELRNAEKIVLPGVGAFDHAMERIESQKWRNVLDYLALEKQIPVLGICLGMQLLTRSSGEGNLAGLGWIPAETQRFTALEQIKIPHMGWNTVQESGQSPLNEGFVGEVRFYFVHSYCVTVDEPRHSFLRSFHGEWFDAGIQRDNIFGVQFHPEKSHRFGMRLLTNFARLQPCYKPE